MESSVPPRLLAFVRSRLPMVEHDFSTFSGENPSHAAQRCSIATYAITQAFFYAADLWVDKPPLVSVKALDYAIERWGDQSNKVWTLKRAEIPRMDGCTIGQSGLIYEHVTTGGMFRSFIKTMLTNRCGVLDPFTVAAWLQNNFQTAWVTRIEDKTLTINGYKSRRGETLDEALIVYKKCGIEISERSAKSPCIVLAGDISLEDEIDVDNARVEESNDEAEHIGPSHAGGDYYQFFIAVAKALQARKSQVFIGSVRNRPYATAKGFNVAGVRNVMLLLDAPRGAKVRTPVLSLEAETTNPRLEPETDNWAALRDTLIGPEWRISYGSDKKVVNALCRCKRSLTHAFEIADTSARDKAAELTAAELDAQWTALFG